MDFIKVVQDGVIQQDPTILGILVAVAVVFLTIVVFAISGRKKKGRGILLVGLCDAGKTLIFTRMVHERYVQSFTSIKENSGVYQLKDDKKNRKVELIDLPGHERTRSQFFDQYKNIARGIIFVVDSLTLQKEVKDAAESIYSILSDRVVSRNSLPVLIACNKHDQTMAKGSKIIQSNLEKEMNTLRITKSAALQGTDDTANNNSFLGKRSKDFQFTDIQPIRVEFVECSARGSQGENGKADLNGIENWLHQVA